MYLQQAVNHLIFQLYGTEIGGKMKKNIVVRGRKDIVAMFEKIAAISGKQNTSRKQATLDIIQYIAKLPADSEETKLILQSAAKQRINESGVDDESVPVSIKIPIDVEEKDWEAAMNVFHTVFDLDGNPQMPYFLRVAGNAYINKLEERNAELGVYEPHTTSIEEFKTLNIEDKLLEIYKFLIERRE